LGTLRARLPYRDIRSRIRTTAERARKNFARLRFITDPTDCGIVFSERVGNGVPEPSTWTMLILGFCGLGYRLLAKVASFKNVGL
jgi:hypothetical protein